MTKNKFIKRYNELTENLYNNSFYSCHLFEYISDKAKEKYKEYMASWIHPDIPNFYNIFVADFLYIDRMFAVELFFNVCLTEKLYKEF